MKTPPPAVTNLVILLLCLIWGSTWLVIRVGLEDVPPLHGVALRFTLACLVFWLATPLARVEGGSAPPAWLTWLFGSLNYAASYGIVYWAETVLPSALASVLWAVFPMMMAVAGHLFLPGERLIARHWLGFAVGFLGVALLFQTDLRDVHADALWVGAVYLLSPLVSCVGQVCVKRHGAGASSVLLNRNALTIAAAMHWIAAATIERGERVAWTPSAVLSIAYLALVGTCVAFGLYYWVLRFTPAYKMSLIAYVTPVFALFLGWSLGEEPVRATTLAGTALVLGGVAWVRRGTPADAGSPLGSRRMPTLRRAAVAAASAAAALALGLFAWSRREPAPSTAIVDDRAEVDALLGARATAADDAADRPLFGPIPEADARTIFSGLKEEQSVYDPDAYYVRAPNLANPQALAELPGGRWVMRTNSGGFREDRDLPARPDRRVVVLGDSHTDGVCPNRASFANVLEATLAERHPGRVIDVVNAGVGSHAFYNYRGALEKYARELAPDVVVVAVYGGNDFLGTLRPRHYFLREPISGGGPQYYERVDRFRRLVGSRADPHLAQAIFQLSFFTEFEDECALALETASALTASMAERARELGIELVLVYLPPMWDVQLERYEEAPEALLRALRLSEEGATRDGNAWADRWIAESRALDVPVVDLRPAFRASPEELYWHADLHVSVAGHARIAQELVPVVEPLLSL